MLSLPRVAATGFLHLKLLSIYQLKQTHAQLIVNGLNSPCLAAKLIKQYCTLLGQQKNYCNARLVFEHFDKPNLFLFNTLIRCSPPKESILVFSRWASRGGLVFDDFTYIFVLGACARSPSVPTLWAGRQIHSWIMKGGTISNTMVQTTLIHSYASNKDVGSARRVFDEMVDRNNVTWNAMITGYCSQRGSARDALVLFRDMLDDAYGAKPTDTTIVSVLSAASQFGVLETGTCMHGYIEKTNWVPEIDVFIGTSLIDMYAKCGCLNSALSVFSRMKEKNILTWTAMATGLAIHGKGKEAIKLLDSMGASRLKPNAVSFTSLLLACCHSGLVEEGLCLFSSMSKFNVTPQMQHYGCIVDLLSRNGLLKEAYEFIMGMPVEPDAILWRSLLSATRIHGDVAMGEKVGKLLIRVHPERSSLNGTSEDYVALSNIYASAGKWEGVETVREEMKVKGIENKFGCSSIQTTTGMDPLEIYL
ncbi:pentatricopeptide repeat-containing protein At3g18970 isoform X1 [Cannabis sativa]|uniref:pentatricopeptide repeat-containing protein At3g18970 isoform X1 n=2 Tax=Cannabis sativa TaxID=3483 RepID=UPI0029CA61B0|nr:pentatricopeptide repeat-containing protein At3g18970 isoform X1 [Cannabis sativa]XP_060966053.1 pentatricopeptide repeat-containing protein At3g18970 isoform X1 [Cannabis sativa]XP_060966054.1 pentatricopeptide repeat-containing protein At3g18970 isoform X1 [Cannabis sativa]XP_060966055.1 pentatricopeptide repeat-containing protein At3g18970 isoform X1 [Cannabis sativa]XP_060966056.1 pentatricopeptide repeat-containing protein At3g18970 isoform X1 [Cannabis sativa]XP_060966057.1 pentatrico